MLAANKMLGARMFTANEAGDVRGGDRSNDRSKHVEPKTRRSESQKSAKSQKSFNSEKSKREKSKKSP